MKTAVIYQSHYGTTRKYAEWIAQALDADLLERSSAKPENLLDYDVIVYGGGLYAGGILGIDLVTKKPCRNLLVFTVGLADPAGTDYTGILEKNLPPELQSRIRIFHLRGGINYKKLSVVHRGMMAMMKRMVAKKPAHERMEEDRFFLETYGGEVDFTDQETIRPIVEYVKAIRVSPDKIRTETSR